MNSNDNSSIVMTGGIIGLVYGAMNKEQQTNNMVMVTGSEQYNFLNKLLNGITTKVEGLNTDSSGMSWWEKGLAFVGIVAVGVVLSALLPEVLGAGAVVLGAIVETGSDVIASLGETLFGVADVVDDTGEEIIDFASGSDMNDPKIELEVSEKTSSFSKIKSKRDALLEGSSRLGYMGKGAFPAVMLGQGVTSGLSSTESREKENEFNKKNTTYNNDTQIVTNDQSMVNTQLISASNQQSQSEANIISKVIQTESQMFALPAVV